MLHTMQLGYLAQRISNGCHPSAACQAALLQCAALVQHTGQRLGSNGQTDSPADGCSQPQHCQQQLGPHLAAAAAAAAVQQQHQQQLVRPLHLLWGSSLQQQQLQLNRHYRTKARPATRHLESPGPHEDSSDGLQEQSRPSSEGGRRKGMRLRSSRFEQEEALAAEELQQQWRQQWHQQQQAQLQQGRPRAASSSRKRTFERPDSERGYVNDCDSFNDGSSTSSSISRSQSRHSPSGGSSSSSTSSRQQQQQAARTAPRARSWQPGHNPNSIERAIRTAGSLQGLQKAIKQHRDHMQQDHISAAYQQVVRLATGHVSRKAAQQSARSASSSGGVDGSSSSSMQVDGSVALDVMRQLNSRLLQQIRVARPWDLAQAVWACSKLHFRDAALLEAVAQQAQRKAVILEPFDICQLTSGYARLSFPQPQLLRLLCTQAVSKAPAFDKPWVLVHTAWALHTAGQNVRELLGVAVPLMREPRRLQQLAHLDMSSLLWLMAVHSMHDAELLQAAATSMAASIDSYSPASTANALMALAALDFTMPQLSAAAAATVVSGLQPQPDDQEQQPQQQQPSHQQQRHYRPRQAALSVFALSKLGACDRALLDATAAAFRREAQAYSPPLLSMLVWACVLAKQGLPQGFVQELVQCSRDKLGAFSGDQLASLLRGVLAMPSQQDSTTPLLLSEAQALLPQVLPHVSTVVLTELIRSLAQQLKLQQQQQVTQLPCPEATLQQASGSSSSSGNSQAIDQQHLLEDMLGACMAEWCQAQRVGQLTKWQAVAVERSLQRCCKDTLAAAAQQVGQNISQATSSSQQHQAPVQVAGGSSDALSPGPQASPGSGGWMDSFVASTR